MIPSFIGLAFGALWLFVGVQAARSPWDIVAAIAGALLFIGAAFRILRRPSRGGRFAWQWYVAAVVAEFAAILVVQLWLAHHHRNDLLAPAVGVIVGAHFLGLWKAMGLRRFVALAGVLVAINLVALLGPLRPGGRLMISGFGSSAALLVSVAA